MKSYGVTMQMKLLQWYFLRGPFILYVLCGWKGANIQMKPFDFSFLFFSKVPLFSTCYKWIFCIRVTWSTLGSERGWPPLTCCASLVRVVPLPYTLCISYVIWPEILCAFFGDHTKINITSRSLKHKGKII